MNYYSLFPENNDSHGVAFAPDRVTFKLLYKVGLVECWKTIEFTLKDGCFTDYQASNIRWHLCSDKLRSIFEKHMHPNDSVQWLPVLINDGINDRRRYSILHMHDASDVLSERKTLATGDFVVRPVLAASKLGGNNIFTYSLETVYVYVSDDIRKAIKKENVTGLDFLKVSVDLTA